MSSRIKMVVLALVVLALVNLAGYQQVEPQSNSSYNGFDLVDKTGNSRKPSDYRDRYQAHRTAFATNFGYSNICSYHINGSSLEIAKDPACPKVPGDGTFRALNGTVSSGPSDNWITPDGAYLYQIYGNASKLVGYATQPDGSLNEITSVKIPYNSPQGLAGF